MANAVTSELLKYTGWNLKDNAKKMTKKKTLLYKLWLWFIRWTRTEEKAIILLKSTDASKVRTGALYEHYGRVLVAEDNQAQEHGCVKCDLYQLALPCCPKCDKRHRFKLLHERHQYATDQNMWSRIMLKRIMRGL